MRNAMVFPGFGCQRLLVLDPDPKMELPHEIEIVAMDQSGSPVAVVLPFQEAEALAKHLQEQVAKMFPVPEL